MFTQLTIYIGEAGGVPIALEQLPHCTPHEPGKGTCEEDVVCVLKLAT